ncbi:MAG: LuxR C-terminal-related transcriptional regulator [Treponema sp.]|jgi:LuxR family maltose regulon positive regulatory protein|nr:LuxR C-terminal-related transcriptional regulator [Treponema sp.]
MSGGILHRDAPPFNADPYYLKRSQLDMTLKKALQSPVVAVTAGRGYGKTSSVYSFLENASLVSLWVQLSGRDNICRRFWENICTCITLRNPELGKIMTGLGFPDSDMIFDRFYGAVEKAIRAMREEAGYVIVYDDFQTIDNPVMLRLFDRILAFPFSKTTIILISRIEPQIKTLPLLSKGLLTRITVEDLRFTPEETAAYFVLRGLSVSSKDIDLIYRDSEGWPLLLNFIAQNAGKQEMPFHYSPEIVKFPLFKIIEDSFFSSLDKNTRKFLIKLSLAGHWPLELLGEMESPAEDLEKLSPFIRYDSYLNGYRIHNLLLEFLTERQGELSREERRKMYLKSARWCLNNSLRMDAASYYEKARDYWGLVNLYFSYPALIPEDTASFLLDITDRLLCETEKGAPENPGRNDLEALLYLRYAIRPKLLLTVGRLEESAAACRQAIAKFEALPSSIVNARILASVYVSLGFVHIFTCLVSKNYRFLPFFEKAHAYFMAYKLHVGRIVGQGIVSPYICQVGLPARAGEFEEYLSNFVPSVSLVAKISGGILTGQDSLGWCEYHYFRGELGTAENFARRAIIQARENRQYEAENRGIFFLLRIAIHGGNRPEIENLLKQIRTQFETEHYQTGSILCDLEYGWFYSQIENPALVASWIRGDSDMSGIHNLNRPMEILIKAKCLFAEKNYPAALDVLEQWGRDNGPRDCLLGRLEMIALEAACNLRLNRRSMALKKLAEAWALSAANGLDMPFIELGEDMRLLAAAALEDMEGDEDEDMENQDEDIKKNPDIPPRREEGVKPRMPRGWLESLRHRAAAYGKTLAAFGSQSQTVDSGIVLRPSETMVLQALSQGLTREEIAGREGLSLYGIKEIIKNIYRKLGAMNRADAIRIAIDRGFLKNSRR